LNGFRAQYVDQYCEKWEIYQVIFESFNDEHQDHVETMYPGSLGCLFAKTLDKI